LDKPYLSVKHYSDQLRSKGWTKDIVSGAILKEDIEELIYILGETIRFEKNKDIQNRTKRHRGPRGERNLPFPFCFLYEKWRGRQYFSP
jgi:hypothetical protein